MFLRGRWPRGHRLLDLRHELIGTLQYIADQSMAVLEGGESSFLLYLITSQSKEAITQLLGGDLRVKVPGVGGGWQIEIVPLGWDRVQFITPVRWNP